MKHFLTFLLLVVSGYCHAADIEAFDEQSTYFYLNPTETNFVNFQKAADELEEQLKSTGNNAELLMAVIGKPRHNWSSRYVRVSRTRRNR